MTFKESEHTNILEKLFEMSKNDLPMEKVIEETLLLLKRIPIYPGIVVGCMDSMHEKINAEEIQPGDFVVLYNKNGERISGIVEKKEKQKIVLKNAQVRKKSNSESVCLDNLKRVIRLKKNTLEKTWPSLVFDKKIKI